MGLLACAVLVANNVRDIPSDKVTGKITLSVRIGDRNSRLVYVGMVAVAAVSAVLTGVAHPLALLALLAVAYAAVPVARVLGGASGRALIPVLRDTGRVELAYAFLLGLGLLLTGH